MTIQHEALRREALKSVFKKLFLSKNPSRIEKCINGRFNNPIPDENFEKEEQIVFFNILSEVINDKYQPKETIKFLSNFTKTNQTFKDAYQRLLDKIKFDKALEIANQYTQENQHEDDEKVNDEEKVELSGNQDE